TRVVHQDVDLPELLIELGVYGFDVGSRAGVSGLTGADATRAANDRYGCFESRRVEVGQEQARTSFGEAAGDGAAKRAAGAGDQRHASVESEEIADRRASRSHVYSHRQHTRLSTTCKPHVLRLAR